MLVLRDMGAQVDYLVPDRFRMAMDLLLPFAEPAHHYQLDLLITVDNGISSHATIVDAKAPALRHASDYY